MANEIAFHQRIGNALGDGRGSASGLKDGKDGLA
jgi:hypothetical protein